MIRLTVASIVLPLTTLMSSVVSLGDNHLTEIRLRGLDEIEAKWREDTDKLRARVKAIRG
jgi:hypothetical protein